MELLLLILSWKIRRTMFRIAQAKGRSKELASVQVAAVKSSGLVAVESGC